MTNQKDLKNSFTSLNFALTISAPISSVPGSPSFFLLQPIFTGKIFAAAGVLLGAQLFLILAEYIFGLKNIPILNPEHPTQKITIPIGELQDFLRAISTNSSDLKIPSLSQTGEGGGEFLIHQTAEIPIVVGISLYAHYLSEPFTPTTWFIIPIFSLPGLRGALPILILEILSTIFVRSVVPPETTGSKPLPTLNQSLTSRLSITPDELFKILQKFSKYFK